jgi:hypothetical protein
MTGHTDLVEEAMQTLDDGGDLLRQVAGVHGEGDRSAASSARTDQMTIQGRPGRGDGYAGGTMRSFGTDARVGSGWMW